MKKGHTVDFDEMYSRYIKVKNTIKSCINIHQIKVAEQMVINFHTWCLNSNFNNEIINLHINHLLDHLYEKHSEFTEKKDS